MTNQPDELNQAESGWYFEDFFPKEVGRLIRQARESAGMTQAQLSEEINRHQASLSAIENGKMEPNASTLVKLAMALKRSVDEFFPRMFNLTRLEGITDREYAVLNVFNHLGDKYQSLALALLNTLEEQEARENQARYEAMKEDDPFEAEMFREWKHEDQMEAEMRMHQLKTLKEKFDREYPVEPDDEDS